MREIHGFQCELCGYVAENEDYAKACKRSHLKPDQLIITSCSNYSQTIRPNVINSPDARIPQQIVVQFSEQPGDFAAYRLQHYGYKEL